MIFILRCQRVNSRKRVYSEVAESSVRIWSWQLKPTSSRQYSLLLAHTPGGAHFSWFRSFPLFVFVDILVDFRRNTFPKDSTECKMLPATGWWFVSCRRFSAWCWIKRPKLDGRKLRTTKSSFSVTDFLFSVAVSFTFIKLKTRYAFQMVYCRTSVEQAFFMKQDQNLGHHALWSITYACFGKMLVSNRLFEKSNCLC